MVGDIWSFYWDHQRGRRDAEEVTGEVGQELL